jgi:hypothetical protein
MRLGHRQTGLGLAVHEQAPHVLERERAGQVLDVDAAVAQGAALAVGLCDGGIERDDALKSRHVSP